ncbi:hypothetical protein C0989_012241, partial [Termitomyces sp. Mn162]
GKRPINRWVVYGSPEIDNLEAAAKKGFRVSGRKMAVYSSNRRCGRLINMSLRYWLTLVWSIIYLSGTATSNGQRDTSTLSPRRCSQKVQDTHCDRKALLCSLLLSS